MKTISPPNLTILMPPTGDSLIGASQTNYELQWKRRIETSDVVLSQSQLDRLELCYLALFRLPNEALIDIKEEMEYKIQYYEELAAYDASRGPALEPPSLQARVNKAATRPLFYLPLNDD